jgi:hypothetical protein
MCKERIDVHTAPTVTYLLAMTMTTSKLPRTVQRLPLSAFQDSRPRLGTVGENRRQKSGGGLADASFVVSGDMNDPSSLSKPLRIPEKSFLLFADYFEVGTNLFPVGARMRIFFICTNAR